MVTGQLSERLGSLAALCLSGAAVYGVAALLFGAANLGEFRRQFTRKGR
jgi:hypothetical protein